MASSKPIPCGPCQEEKVNIKADIWCYNCDEGLCSTCSCHHKRINSSRDHKTIDIKSYKPSIQAIKTECDKHGQQFNLYCPSHLIPCCDECISTNHSKCTGIKSLTSVVEKTKIQKSKESVEKDINSNLHLLDKMVNNKSTNIKTGEQQCEGIKGSIVKIRNQMNKHLDDLEKKLCQETNDLLDQENSTARDFISECKEAKTKLKTIQEHLHRIETHTSKLHSFLGIHQLEQQVHQHQQYVDNLEKDNRTKAFDIKLKQNDEIENILKKLGSLESMGEVLVVKTETDLNRETSVRKEAQVESRVQSNINNMTMNIEKKIGINIEKRISDMICLMDGRLIVVEYYGKVNVLTSEGKLHKQLPIPGDAWIGKQINQNTIVITYPEEEAILKIFNMENETVTKVITLDKTCFGLSFSNNSLAVGLDNDEIRIIDLEGNTLKSIQVESKSYLWYLVYCNDRVIYTDYIGKAVYCVDESGKQIWQCKHFLGPLGLCTDAYGNIIVADYDSHRIIVISKDGQNGKVLIDDEDDLGAPLCICFKHNESAGFICDFDGTKLTKFNLSSG